MGSPVALQLLLKISQNLTAVLKIIAGSALGAIVKIIQVGATVPFASRRNIPEHFVSSR